MTGSLIEKIQSPAKNHLTLTFFGRGGKRQLWWKYERQKPFCFVTSPAGSGTKPEAWVMRLRKYAVGSRMAAVVPQYLQRRLWLLLSGGDVPAGKTVWLCLDLREGATLHFLQPEEAPGMDDPAWPEPHNLGAALENWREWPILTPDLRRAFAQLEERDQWALLNDLREGGGDIFLYRNAANEICEVHAWPPAKTGDLRVEAAQDVALALEKAGQDLVLGGLDKDRRREESLPGQRRVKKLQKLLAKLEEEENRLTRMARRKEDALALRENLWQLSREFRGSEIILPYAGEERRVALDARFGLRENMEGLFHLARRGERGLAMLGGRREAIQREIDDLSGGSVVAPRGSQTPARGEEAQNQPKKPPRNVQVFTSSQGYTLLRGRDAKGNQAVRKLARPYDVWLHVESGPGAHVIIRRKHQGDIVPDETLAEAGALAANKSWLKDAATAQIVYAEARHISPMKNAPAGTMRIARVLDSRAVAVRPELEEKLAK